MLPLLLGVSACLPVISNGIVDSNTVIVRPVYPRTQYTCQYAGAPRVNAGQIAPQSSGGSTLVCLHPPAGSALVALHVCLCMNTQPFTVVFKRGRGQGKDWNEGVRKQGLGCEEDLDHELDQMDWQMDWNENGVVEGMSEFVWSGEERY